MDELIFGDMIDPRRGSVYATNDLAGLETFTFGSNFHYLTVRLGVLFTVGQGHWRWSSSVGVAPALLLDARSTTVSTYQNGDRTKEVRAASDPYRDLGLFPYVSTGVAYHTGGRWEWSLRPTARYGVLRIIDAPISGHLFSGTVDLGMRYSL